MLGTLSPKLIPASIFLLSLKRAGATLSDLVKAYCTFVRPVLEYAAPVWHSSLSSHQSEQLERVQRQTLRIFLPEQSYRLSLQSTGLESLYDRRVHLCRAFASSLLKSKDFCDWLPPKHKQCHSRNLRNNNKLSMMTARTNRFANSPIAFFAKLLNSVD